MDGLKGLILAGGRGTRLRPLTHTSAKQLVPVANKPVLFYGIESLAEAGITDIGMIVAPETAGDIRAAVGDGERFGVSVTYIEQDAPRGLAHAVLTAEEFLGDSPFVMYLGDNLLKDGIVDLVDRFRSERPDALILLTPVPDPEHYGVAELEDGRVARLVEKPPEPTTDLALVGVYMFSHPVFDAARAIEPSDRGELEITDAIQRLIDTGLTVDPHIVRGWWKDTGQAQDMLDANQLILDDLEPRIEGELIDSRTASSSTPVPITCVRANASWSLIDRSTCVSAAKFTTASQPRITARTTSGSSIAPWTNPIWSSTSARFSRRPA